MLSVCSVQFLLLHLLVRCKSLTQQEKAVYDVQSKQENNLISHGHNRILEKVKTLHQGFLKVVLAGRSGSGKLVYDYDSSIGIWGDSPNTEPLPFRC